MTNNAPEKAVPVRYSYGRNKGVFFIWQSGSKLVLGQKWYWSALGNQGKENTREQAIEAARVWIVSSVSKSNQ